MVCRTALPDRPRGPRGGAPNHLPDHLKFAGPLAGPGVVRWSVKPNRSPDNRTLPALSGAQGTPRVQDATGVLVDL